MANFQKHGENVNGRVLHTSPGKLYELGVWGPVDTRTMTELDVSIRPASALVTVKRAGMVPGQNVRIWQLIGLPVGRFVVEARDGGGSVWTSVTIDTTPQPQEAAAGGRKYTDNPNEQVTKRTTPTARDVVTMLMAAWSDLTQNGARTLAAQFMAKTGSGRYCFNWNLGNVKAGPNEPHMYLRGVWEVDSVAGAQTQVANAGGLAHVASDDEIKKHGWGCRAGESIAVFDPPHPQCRFRAYGSLTEGAKRWLGRYQKIAQRNSRAPALATAPEWRTDVLRHARNSQVDIDGISVPLNGRVHDCAIGGKTLAVVTASSVVLISLGEGVVSKVSSSGGDRVAISPGWVAWSNAATLNWVQRKGHPFD